MKKLTFFLLSCLFCISSIVACPHEMVYDIADLEEGSEGWYCSVSISNQGDISSHWCSPTEECTTCACDDQIALGGDATDQAAADYLFGLANVDMFNVDYTGIYTAAIQPSNGSLRHYQVSMYLNVSEGQVHQVFTRID